MRALVLVHRWLGVACCLMFATWFASGIVMHFVPFPSLTEAERIHGMAPVNPALARYSPGEAVIASGIEGVTRVRILARTDGLMYLVKGASGVRAISAGDLSPAAVTSASVALTIAIDHARRFRIDTGRAALAELADYDQWTVPNSLDRHRPLYRIAVNDEPGTELYVSSATGEVVLDTTRRERWWNYAGSVAHWIYPTVLRRDSRVWNAVVWTLALVALIAALCGAVLGTLRVGLKNGRIVSPYEGWHAWHHWLGLGCMTFLLTWIFSGWLSMDHGWLFSTGRPAAAESAAYVGNLAWESVSTREVALITQPALEIEWFAFGGKIYRRERFGLTAQSLSAAGETATPRHAFLEAADATAAARPVAACSDAIPVDAMDDYPIASSMPNAPVFRSRCADVWFHVDGANGALLEKLDASRRAYRWAYGALHTLDFPVLSARPALRTAMIVALCGLGLAFSLTAVVIGWRRLKQAFS